MASKNTTAAAYQDCFHIMDQALAASGIRVVFSSRSKATVFRHRCYKGRSFLYGLAKKSVPAGVAPSTQYDDIFIRYESDFVPGGSDCVLVFDLRSRQELPVVTDLVGQPLAPPERPLYADLKIPGISLDD